MKTREPDSRHRVQKTVSVTNPNTFRTEEKPIKGHYIYTLSNKQFSALYYVETVLRNIGIRNVKEEEDLEFVNKILDTKEYETKDRPLLNELMTKYEKQIKEYLKEI